MLECSNVQTNLTIARTYLQVRHSKVAAHPLVEQVVADVLFRLRGVLHMLIGWVLVFELFVHSFGSAIANIKQSE